jgi:hypothetical protein
MEKPNLDSLIDNLEKLLHKKYIEKIYLLTNNLAVNPSSMSGEIIENWNCFLKNNNIEFLFECHNECSGSSGVFALEQLISLINHEPHRFKNNIIFSMWLDHLPFKTKYYLMTTRENAQKFVVFETFEQ